MAATTIGLNNLKFGTGSSGALMVRSYEETIKCDPVELLSGDGTFKAVALANPNSSVNITLVTSSPTGTIGASFTGGAENSFLTGMDDPLYIDSVSQTLTNDGFSEVQISASGWLNLNQVE